MPKEIMARGMLATSMIAQVLAIKYATVAPPVKERGAMVADASLISEWSKPSCADARRKDSPS
jgi:transposase